MPLAGHDRLPKRGTLTGDISIHVPLAGHDFDGSDAAKLLILFQSTCPLRGTTPERAKKAAAKGFQSTCPLRGTTTCVQRSRSGECYFNPRAPCGARRCRRFGKESDGGHFNPRAPCGARPFQIGDSVHQMHISIRVPLAGHDLVPKQGDVAQKHFNPRAPCGARQPCSIIQRRSRLFQSACPLRGTTTKNFSTIQDYLFQSACPLRGTTGSTLRFRTNSPRDFNPRAPCGARRSTPRSQSRVFFISIRVPLAGHDKRHQDAPDG